MAAVVQIAVRCVFVAVVFIGAHVAAGALVGALT